MFRKKFKHVFTYLTGMATEKQREREVSSIPWLTIQKAAKARLGPGTPARSLTWMTEAQGLVPPSSTLPDTKAGSWVTSRATRIHTSTLVRNVVFLDSSVTYEPPCCPLQEEFQTLLNSPLIAAKLIPFLFLS